MADDLGPRPSLFYVRDGVIVVLLEKDWTKYRPYVDPLMGRLQYGSRKRLPGLILSSLPATLAESGNNRARSE